MNGISGVTVSEGVGAEVLLWLVGFQQGIKDLVRRYIVFIVQMSVFSEFCLNTVLRCAPFLWRCSICIVF